MAEEDEMHDEEKALVMAHVAEAAERYDEMADYMVERVQKGGPLSGEERDLLSAAFKGALSSRRHALRVASSVQKYEVAEGRIENSELAMGYQTKIEAEMQQICEKALKLLNTSLVERAEVGEPKTFFLKMQGDYYRYAIEFERGQAREAAIKEAMESYNLAMTEAAQHLLTTHPVRLGLALNLSVFYHEVVHDTNEALRTAKAALSAATAELDSVPIEAQRDAMLSLQLLQDNITLWEPPGGPR
eukprot:gnl/TRDRNA2_/TRDRNA2_69022_c0_seq1.p1 gnl/TRDRNA2_/TRDRNA2_69022_c0~~gnl/TRDRNA2_/TRDRNA2_69022_c0_seq1.p1  ORF type:complete len:245 (-),score=67.37 gnl/TRDRNA2_/TRDRNA2_69022_c0_seq1:135-869(-)